MYEKAFRKITKKWYPYWFSVLKHENISLMHSHFGQYGVINQPLASKLNIPHVVSFYGADMNKAIFYNPELEQQYRDIFRKVSAVFVEGNYAKSTLYNLGCPSEKIFISHLGVDLNSL
jgi:colanic acid/amylovoran biosynthesis glycosyltransferase